MKYICYGCEDEIFIEEGYGVLILDKSKHFCSKECIESYVISKG